MKKDLVLLVDGNALLYRAYHAFPKELSSPKGELVGAIYGFTRILLSTLKTLDPCAAAVCFDLKGATFRHEEFKDYKATREKMPEDLAGQIERTHEIVEKLEIPIYTYEGYEADDLIGTLARQAVEADKKQKVVILTGDQDIIQLVNDNVSVYAPVGPKGPVMYDPAKVMDKYGFTPGQMTDYKGLRGDPSDNIPGVPGVGEVTATKLLQEFTNLEGIYKAIDEGKTDSIKPAVLQKLKDNKESAFFSRKIATIDTDAPVSFNLSACMIELKDPKPLLELFKELNFKSLMRDLPASHRILSEAQDIFDDASSDSESTTNKTHSKTKSDEIDAEVMPVLRDMEQCGVILDVNYLKELEKEFTGELEQFKKQLTDLAGEEFNPDSPSQIAHILYEVLQIPTTYIRKGKTGYTTDAATLQGLAKEYPICAVILQYRELNKLLNTYVLPLQTMVDDKSRVHTSYAADTATGRLSSRNPNLQNIPVRTEQGKRLRKAFVAEKGWTLVAADYSQLELRIAAHLSGDPIMKKAFKEGRDFHSETAEQMKVDRSTAKMLNFSILYGKGPYGFSQDLGITLLEAKQYIEQYFKTFHVLREYLDNVLKETRANGYAETLYGRRREFPDINNANFIRRSAAEREASNMPIQGTEADILKMAMKALADRLQKEKLKARLILTVHDELVIECPDQELKTVTAIMHDTMENVVELSVPLEVSVKAGTNWAEMEKLN